jgi:hypothetical protein
MTTTTDFDTTKVAPLWSTKDLATFLGCSERQIPRLRDEGLPAVRIRGLIRFIPSRVMLWLAGREDQVASDARASQLADIATSGDEDAAEIAAADLAREFPHPLP